MRYPDTENPSRAHFLPDPVPSLAALVRVREPGSETKTFIGLDHNERLAPFPDWFVERIRQSVGSALLTKYPVQDELHRRLCREFELREEQLLLTPGSDAAVKAVYQVYVRRGDRIVILDPTYAMYSVYAQMFGGEAIRISFDRELRVDTDFLLSRISTGVRLVMLANPNQPTATLLDEQILKQVIDRAHEIGALVAVDEAYYPFSHMTVLPWIREKVNLVVIRSFSKAAGLAGLRIGFVAGHEEVVQNLYKVRSIYDVNSMAILCAEQILSHPEVVDDYVAQVEEGKQLLAARAAQLGLVALPTHTNFIFLRVGHRCAPVELVERLRDHRYLVKTAPDHPCLVDCIRVTLGPPELMAAFADILEELMNT